MHTAGKPQPSAGINILPWIINNIAGSSNWILNIRIDLSSYSNIQPKYDTKENS